MSISRKKIAPPRIKVRPVHRLMVPVLLVAALFASGVLLGSRSTQAQEPSPCEVTLSRQLSASQIELGETLQVTLSVAADCTSEPAPLHIVFALDTSGSMAGTPLSDAQEAILDLAEGLELENNPETRVGLVTYNSGIPKQCELSNQLDDLRDCFVDIQASGGSRIDLGIQAALTMIRRGRNQTSTTVREVMVVLTDGANNSGCEPVVSAARQAKSQGILIATICAGASCDRTCMRQAASSSSYFYDMQNMNALAGVFEFLRENGAVKIRDLQLTEPLPGNLGFSGSNDGTWDAVAKEILWAPILDFQGRASAHYTIEPQELGMHTFGDTGRVEFRDDSNRLQEVFAQASSIRVLPNNAPPLPDDDKINLSLTTENETMDIGDRVDATFSLDFELPELAGDTHLAMTLDASGSMAGSPHDNMIAAGTEMLDTLEQNAAPSFQAGINFFNSTSKVLCVLMSDFGQLRACLNKVGSSGGTAIDAGLEVGHSILEQGRPWEGPEDIILLTDGANNSGCAPVLEIANDIKTDEVLLHVICMGVGCDTACMRQVASSERHYFQIANSEQLDGVFENLALDLLARRDIENAQFHLRLPDHLEIVPNSFSLEPDQFDASSASWDLLRIAVEGQTIDFQVEAISNGTGRIEMDVDVDRLKNLPLNTSIESQELIVGDEPVVPTESPTSPPDTPIPPTNTPDSNPPSSIFLPLLLGEACAGPPADIVILVDTSLSMAERFDAEGNKLNAAQESIHAFFDGLQGVQKRVALLSFDAEARIIEDLDSGMDDVLNAMAMLELGSGTALDAGIDLAGDVLADRSERSGSRGIIVIISDGRAHEADPEDAIQAANRARSLKLEIHTIGLGHEVDRPLLSAIADSPEQSMIGVDRRRAERVFKQTGRRIHCPAHQVWGTALMI